MRTMMVYYELLLVAVLAETSVGQNCDLPTAEDLENVIQLIISSTGDSPATPSINVADMNVVCRAFSDTRDLYRAVSVVVEYTCTGSSDCPSMLGPVMEQIESECSDGEWSVVTSVPDSVEHTHSQTFTATFSTALREDCSFCLSPILAERVSLTSDETTHCVACDWSCNRGHARCFGLAPSLCQEEPATSSCCNFYHGSRCVADCPTPYIGDGDNNCVCPVGTTGLECEVVDCGCLGNPEDGFVMFTNTTYDAVATYSCQTGYNLMGNDVRTCLDSGLWSDTAPACTVVDCDDLMDPDNGKVSFSTHYNALANYSCKTGHTLSGDEERRCLESGEWSGEPPTCSVVDCGELDIANGKVSYTLNTAYNSEATYSCDEGYTLSEATTRKCLDSGDWSGTASFCSIVDCGCLQTIENGSVSVLSSSYQSAATYSCNTGYTLIGDKTRTCTASGVWAGTEPTCSINDTAVDKDEEGCQNTCAAGAVGGALGSILLVSNITLLIVCCCLLCKIRSLKQVHPNDVESGDKKEYIQSCIVVALMYFI